MADRAPINREPAEEDERCFLCNLPIVTPLRDEVELLRVEVRVLSVEVKAAIEAIAERLKGLGI